MAEEKRTEEQVQEQAKKSRKTYPTLKTLDQTVESKSQLRHDWMQDWVAANRPEDLEALLAFEEAHQVHFKSNIAKLKDKTRDTTITDIKKMREWFLKNYGKEEQFKQALEVKSKSKKTESNMERIRRLVEERKASANSSKGSKGKK